MTRTATEAKSHATAEWIASRVGARRYRRSPGRCPAPSTFAAHDRTWPGGSDWDASFSSPQSPPNKLSETNSAQVPIASYGSYSFSRFRRPFVIRKQGHPGNSGVFPPAALAHVLPELSDLMPAGPAIHKVMVAGLPLVLAASPAPIGRQLVNLVTQVVTHRCVPRQGADSSGPRGPCVHGGTPFEASAACSAVGGRRGPLSTSYPRRPCLSGHSGHLAKLVSRR